MRNLSITLLILALIIVVFPLPKVHAAAPTNVQITANNSSGSVYGTNLNFNANVFADKIQSLSNEINFTNIAYSVNTGATQNFGTAQCCSSNGLSSALNDIKSDHVEFILTFTSGNPKLYFYYIMPSGIAFNVPQTVLHIYQGSTTTINQASYYTDATAFANCLAPCVFQNTANKTLVIKSINLSPVTVNVYFPVFGGGGGEGGAVTTTTTTAAGGDGGGGGGCVSNCGGGGGGLIISTTTTTATVGGIPPETGNPADLATGFAIVASLIVLTFGYAEYRKRSNPKSGYSKLFDYRAFSIKRSKSKPTTLKREKEVR